MSVVRYLPITAIRRRPDARALDEANVAALAESIKLIGLRSPISVRLVDDEYELIAGSHRLAALERLGEREAFVTEVAEDDLHAELAMIDENLCRVDLSPADRARQTARRKAIYEELHPETRAGVAGAVAKHSAVDSLSTASFANATADATGRDPRSIRHDAERGEKVIDEVVDLVRGTHLDTGAYLDNLKGLSPNDQITAARRDLARGRTERTDGAAAARVKAASLAETRVESAAADRLRNLIRLLDEIAAVAAADIAGVCPVRERAALASRLSPLIDRFTALLEEIAP